MNKYLMALILIMFGISSEHLYSGDYGKYHNDFSASGLSDFYAVGNWTVVNGKLQQQNNSVLGYITLRNGGYKNFTFQSKLKFMQNTSWIALHSRLSSLNHNPFNSGYFAYVWASGQVMLYEAGTGMIGSSGVICDPINNEVDLRVQAIQDNIKVFVNDELAIQCNDATFSEGFAGMSTYTALASFDDFSIQEKEVLQYSNFADGSLAGWQVGSGTWAVVNQELVQSAGNTDARIAISKHKITDFEYETDIQFLQNSGWAGFHIRKTEYAQNSFQSGYLVFLRPSGRLSFYKAGVGEIQSINTSVDPLNNKINLKVTALGSEFKVFINGLLMMNVSDDTFSKGYTGLVGFFTPVKFDNVILMRDQSVFEEPMNHEVFPLARHPNLLWRNVGFGGVDLPEKWDVQIASDDDFSALEANARVVIPRYVPANQLTEGQKFWRVRCVNQAGVAGAWSEVRCFTVNATATSVNIPAGSDLATIRSIIETALLNDSVTINFEPGTYNLSPAENETHCISITSKNNFVINGNNANIIINNPKSGFMKFYNCRNGVIKNFFIDYDPLPQIAAVVIGRNTNPLDAYIDVQIIDGHPDYSPSMAAAEQTHAMIMNTECPGRLMWYKKNFYNFETRYDQIGTRQYRFYLETDADAGDFDIGATIVRVARVNTGLFSMVYGEDVTLRSITAYSAPSSFLTGMLSSKINVLYCNTDVKSGRFMSTNADAVHCQSFRVGPWVSGCFFRGQGDDAINIYTVPGYVSEKLNSVTIRLYRTAGTLDLQPGDDLIFWNPSTPAIISRRKIVSILGNSSYWEVVCDGDVGTLNPGNTMDKTHVYDMSRTGNRFMVTSNNFADSRRFGLFIKSCDGAAVGNNFNALSSSAIYVANEPSWPEGFICENIKIYNNNIYICGFDNGYFVNNLGSIYIALIKYPHLAATVSEHRNIFIRNNLINNWHLAAIRVKNAENVYIENNTINSQMTGFYYPENYCIDLNYITGYLLNGNLIYDPRSWTDDIRIQNSTP